MIHISFSFRLAAIRLLCATGLVLGGSVGSSALAGQLKINQVADNNLGLTVFVTVDQVPSTTGESGNSGFAAALGSQSLPVKSITTLDRTQGVTLVVALDVSASLGATNFSAMKEAVSSTLRKLPANSQVALVSIGAEVKTVHDFTDNIGEIITALNSISPSAPETALYEAVIAAQEMAARSDANFPKRRAVVVITDAIDDSRRGFGREEALQKIAVGDVPLLSVVIASKSPATTQREAIKTLAQISRASGGDFQQTVSAGAKKAVDTLVTDVFKPFALELDCTECPRDGAVRRLQISRQEGRTSTTDSRDIRLLSVTTKLPPPNDDGKQPKPEKTNWQQKQWLWFAIAIAALLVVFGIAMSKRRKQDENLIPEPIPDPEEWHDEPIAIDLPDTPIQVSKIQRQITLDVAGSGRMTVVLAPEATIGRAQAVDVSLVGDFEASNKHASLSDDRGVLILKDLGSTNGTFLNGIQIQKPEPVSDRDCILVGRTEIRVYF